MAAAAAVAPSHALDAPASAVVFTDDPLGVRGDFPILQNGRTFLNSAYITPSPRAVTAAGVAFLEAKSARPMTVGELLSKAGAVRVLVGHPALEDVLPYAPKALLLAA